MNLRSQQDKAPNSGLISQRTRMNRKTNRQASTRTISHAIFSPSFSQRDEHKLMKVKTYKQFAKTSWAINKESYENLHWKQLWECMKSSTCRQLVIVQVKIPKIIKDISHVGFQELIYLSLPINMIDNGQAVGFLDMPNLRYLLLSLNCISNSSFLKKINLKKLENISLQKNHIKQLTRTVGRLHAPSCFQYLQIIDIESQPYEYGRHTMPESLQFMVKLEYKEMHASQNIHAICRYWSDKSIFESKNKIVFQPNIVNAIKRKFNKY